MLLMEHTNWSVIGHDWAVDLLQHAIAAGRPSHAYLVTGMAHIGRRTLALALARALNCTREQPPCDMRAQAACRACSLTATGGHPDVRVVMPEGASIKISQIRELQHDLALSPVEARFRVTIIDGMEQATLEASNALLKTLEEPSPHVVLILIASEPKVLLPTIVSRCQHLPLRPLTIEQVSQALVALRGLEAQRADQLAHLSGGRVGWALAAAQDETVLQKRAARLDDLLRLLGAEGRRVERFAYAEQLANDGEAIQPTLELWASWWRDVMLVAAGSTAPLANIDRPEALRQHAAQFGLDRARGALVSLSRTAWQIAHNANARLALEVLLLDWP